MATLAERDTRSYAIELLRTAGLDALVCVWLFASAFVLNHGNYYVLINNVFCGGVAMILAFGPFARARMAWVGLAVGAWVIISPFVLAFTDNVAATLSNVLAGTAIMALEYRAWVVRRSAEEVGAVTPE
jgi:hypothetical protein